MKKIYLLALLFVGIQSQAQCWTVISAENNTVAGIKSDKSLWLWGSNNKGQIGDGTTTNRNSPKQIAIGSTWNTVAVGFDFTVAIKADGTLWAWGQNDNHQLGDNSTLDKLVPTQIGTDTNWKSVYAGDAHVIAVKTDGSLWQWGVTAMHPDLAGDPVVDSSLPIPTQIGIGYDWTTAQSIAAGGYHNLAVKQDGTLWAWGNNYYKQLGNGTTVNQLQPTQIGTDTDWKFVSGGSGSSFGIKTNGTLYGWGVNGQGRLGIGTDTNSEPITQIGSLTSWKFVEGGNTQTIGFTTTGQIYTWGDNSVGQLGNGTTSSTPTLSPINIRTNINVMSVTSGDLQTYIMSSNFGISAAGSNGEGQLGTGDNNPRSSHTVINCPTTTLATNDFSKTNSLSIYPNPTKEVIYLNLNNTATSYEIFDAVGKTIVSGKLTKQEINVSSLPKGIYLLKVKASEGTLSTKFIKE